MMHFQPLYRRGPNWSSRIHSAHWPDTNLYGPPITHDDLPALEHILSFDCRMFALYFLITETIATYLGYRMVQQLMKGKQLPLLAPKHRLWIAFTYCALKLRLIDYAFHGTVYLVVSIVVAFVFCVCALLAIAFHFGPLQFVFVDVVTLRGRRLPSNPKQRALALQTANASPFQVGLRFVLRELKFLFVKQHCHEFALELARIKRNEAAVAMCPAPTVNGIAHVEWFFGGVLELDVAEWNEWITHYAFPLVVASGVKKIQRKKPRASTTDDLVECRFLVLMQSDGLIVDFIIREPTAALVYRLRTGFVSPFELVLRFLSNAPAARDRVPHFLYAECAKMLGARSTPDQKTSLFAMLQALNAMGGRKVDVPLRALRCQDFVAAETFKDQPCKRVRAHHTSLTSQFESAFG